MQEQKQKQKRKQVKVVKDDERDFLWMMTEEPHRSRRKAILKAHPEVRPGQCTSLIDATANASGENVPLRSGS
jgi:hypothetical protein